MSGFTHMATLEVVQLTDGRYTVRELGSDALIDGTPIFDSLTEAEEWLFLRNQALDDDSSELHTLKPGGGQGVP
jgi:hypothetical protein